MKKSIQNPMIQILEGTVFIEDLEEFLQKLKKISRERNLTLQALDADKIAGKEHIMFAVEKAMNSFRKGSNIAYDLAKEIMIYAAGTRQISRALRLGVHEGHNNIVLVAVGYEEEISAAGEEFNEIEPGHTLEYNGSKRNAVMEVFRITEEEIEAVGETRIPELVLERVALVDVIK